MNVLSKFAPSVCQAMETNFVHVEGLGRANYVLSSPIFHEGLVYDLSIPDVQVLSTDRVTFHVHTPVLFRSSNNGFAGLSHFPLDVGIVFRLGSSSDILNIVLATVYGISYEIFSQDLRSIIAAIDSFHVYGLDVSVHLHAHSLPAKYLSAQAASSPLLVYALASRHNLEHLAVSTSSYLLEMELDEAELSEDMAQLIGPSYLKRLFDAHRTRQCQLYDILFQPLPRHQILPDCDYYEYSALSKAWTLAAGSIIFRRSVANLTEADLRRAFGSIEQVQECNECKAIICERLNEIVDQWDKMKKTI